MTARLLMADGRLLTFRRRKGRGRTLTDGDGAPIEEAQLAGLLGGISKERFETFFALDHQDLRKGGADLLTAEGEIGRLVIEAGGGLRPLVRRLEQLDVEIDGLFSPRRAAERAFYKALDAFTAADQAAKAGVLSPTQYERLRAAVEAAERQRDELRDQKAAAVRALSRLQRSGRVAVPLRQLDEARTALAALDDLPPLPDDFDDLVAAAEQRLRRAKEEAEQANERVGRLAGRLAELKINPAWSAAEPDILDLGQKRVIVAKQREDRPNRVRELAEAELKLAALRRRLCVGPDEDLAARLPPAADVEQVRALAVDAQRREPQLVAAGLRVAELEAELAALEHRIAETRAAGRHEPLGITAADIASLPSAVQTADLRRRQALAALAKAEDAAATLGFGTLATLESTPFPTAPHMTEELRVLEELQAEVRLQAKASAEAESDQALQAVEAKRLARGGAPATDESVRDARLARNQALAPLREAHREGKWPGDADARVSEVEEVDRAVATADNLADRRASEAQRAAEHAQALRLGDAAAVRKAAAQAEVKRLAALLAARTNSLAAAFPVAAKLYPDPRALEEAVGRRDVALATAAEARTQLERVETDESLLAGPLDLLAHVERATGVGLREDSAIGERVRKALTAIAAHDEAHADFRRDAAAFHKVRADVDAAKDRRESLRAAQTDWSTSWATALPKLGLEPRLSPDEAAAAAMEWAAAEGVLTTVAATRRRLGRMEDDEADLRDCADALGKRLGLQLPEDALAKVDLLQRRWSEQQALSSKHEALAAELQQHREEAERSEAAMQEAALAIEQLRCLAVAANGDEAALAKVRERHRARIELRAGELQLLKTLAAAGDGFTEAELRADWQGVDRDALTAEETRLAGDVDALEAAHAQAIEAAVTARAEFEDALDEKGFNAALAAREAAVADLHRVAERYVPLALARDMLKEVIAKVRAQQQDPLIARAGSLMSALTRGAFSGVAADIDGKGQPVVVGINADGRPVPVGLMSDGARDQLYLAFRLAGLESYCATAEPLPFVADDLLVHFDDARTTVALDILADFGATTQVLLFTHHESVRDAAEPLMAKGRAQVLELG
ncbi:MAG: AAA family ATPase [Pseudomonadota bacterium]